MSNRWNAGRGYGPILGLVLLGVSHTRASDAGRTAPRPNVLLLVADDCRAILGCYGEEARTPHLDGLAKRGLRFDRAYCQYPLCSPSRTSFLTGRRPSTTGILSNTGDFRNRHPDIQTLPQWFRSHGYRVARVGKVFHYGVPRQIGTDGADDPASWEERINPRGRDCDDEDRIYSIVAGPTARVKQGTGNYGGTLSWLQAEGEDREQTDGQVAAAACALLERYRNEPFFLAVGFYRPHTPYVATRPYFERYPRDSITLAPFPPDGRAGIPATAFTVNPPHYGMDAELQRTVKQAYLASVSFMDAQAGSVLAALDRLGLASNTVVAFISDHGYHLGEHGQWQKMTVFEEAARVPFILAVPGQPTAGRATGRLAELVDLYPTLADLCGLPRPEGLEGISLRPLIDDPDRPWAKAGAFTQVIHGTGGGRVDDRETRKDRSAMGRSVRTERYRYTEWDHGAHGTELYDHDHDPREQRNRAEDPAYADIRRQLAAQLRAGGTPADR